MEKRYVFSREQTTPWDRLTTGLGFKHEDKWEQCGSVGHGARREWGNLFHNRGAARRKDRFAIVRRDYGGQRSRVINPLSPTVASYKAPCARPL